MTNPFEAPAGVSRRRALSFAGGAAAAGTLAVTGGAAPAEASVASLADPADDTATASFINDPDSETRAALDDFIDANTEPVENILAHGATPAAASAAIQAAHDALPTKGGIIVIPAGDWECASTIFITKQVEIRGAGGSAEFSNTRLRFAANVKGLDVGLPNSGDTFKMSDVAVLSYSTAYSAGKHGVHIKKCRPIIENCVAYQFADHGWFFDSTHDAPPFPDNVNHGVCTNIRAYGNRGDGIRIQGPDSNAMTFINADVVSNYGWGINCMGRHNLFLHPHADQRETGIKGAYRDDSHANRWEMVYSEGSTDLSNPASVGRFLIDSNSRWGYFSTSNFGKCYIDKAAGVASGTWEIVQMGGARERVRTTNGTTDFVLGVGLISPNALDVVKFNQDQNPVNVASMKSDGTENTWWGSHYPAANNTVDLGWTGARWRDVHVGRYINLGGLYLRNNNGTLEKSTNLTTWTAV